MSTKMQVPNADYKPKQTNARQDPQGHSFPSLRTVSTSAPEKLSLRSETNIKVMPNINLLQEVCPVLGPLGRFECLITYDSGSSLNILDCTEEQARWVRGRREKRFSPPFRIATLTGNGQPQSFEKLDLEVASNAGSERIPNIIRSELPMENFLQTTNLYEGSSLVAVIPEGFQGAKLLLGIEHSRLFPQWVPREKVPRCLLQRFPKAVFFGLYDIHHPDIHHPRHSPPPM